jgi:hypothetical protein
MDEVDEVRADLLRRVASRRVGVQGYLRTERPRTRRRATLTIVLSTLAAISAAGPAVGGESFVGGVQRALGLPSESVVWRVLCLVALLVSVGAAILTNLDRSHDRAARLAGVEAVEGELEGLAVLLEFGQLSVQDAVKLYQQYTSRIAFVPDVPDAADGRPAEVAAAVPAGPPSSADGTRRRAGVPAVPPAHRESRRPTVGRRRPGPPPPR